MRVLVACEESQRVCSAFRLGGAEAYSCDIIECSGGHPEWHIMQDVLPMLNGHCTFKTMDGVEHTIDGKWDLIIAHPPCTRLCSSGQRWCSWKGGTEEYRQQKCREREESVEFFMKFVEADCDHIAIENPMGIMSTRYRKPDQIYNPYDFKGETDCKKTCLWLKGLPALKPTQFDLPKEKRTQGIEEVWHNGKLYAWNHPDTAMLRSRTPFGVADAMADQWISAYIKRRKDESFSGL